MERRSNSSLQVAGAKFGPASPAGCKSKTFGATTYDLLERVQQKENSASFCQNSFAKQTTVYRIGHARTSGDPIKTRFFIFEAATSFHSSLRVYRLAAAPLQV
jgi:hypothetical protein